MTAVWRAIGPFMLFGSGLIAGATFDHHPAPAGSGSIQIELDPPVEAAPGIAYR